MNSLSAFAGQELWHIAGWTMLHYLWLGALVGLFAILCRLLLRRASANLRYATALTCLALLAALPAAIASWLTFYSPPLKVANPPWQGETQEVTSDPVATIELNSPDFSSPTATNQHEVIDLRNQSEPLATAADLPEVEIAPTITPNSEPSPNRSLVERGVSIAALEACVPYLPWLWIIGTPLTFALLAAGIVGTKRLQRASRAIDDPRIIDMLTRLQESLRIGRRVSIAICDRIASPVLIGIVRPMILLPPAALTGWSPDEVEMVLLHELAHVRRWDNLVNLVQRLIESLLFFHPAVWLISNWARRERESCCDAFVVRRTERPHAYAELLVALAAQIPRSVLFHPTASSAMSAGPLRTRIRRILQLEDDPMLISGKSLALMLCSLFIAATLAVLYLPTISQAEQEAAEELTTEVTESTEKKADEDKNSEKSSSSDPTLLISPIDTNDPAPDHKDKTADEPQVVATFPHSFFQDPNSEAGKQALAAYEVAREKGQYVDLQVHKSDVALVIVPKPTEANWPDVLGEVPRKNRVIADAAYARLGLKLAPLTQAEMAFLPQLGKPVGLQIVGGDAPKGLPRPSILTNIDNEGIPDMDALLNWLESEQGRSKEPVRVNAIVDDNEYLFEMDHPSRKPQPPASTFQSSLDSPPNEDETKRGLVFFYFYHPESKPSVEMRPVVEQVAKQHPDVKSFSIDTSADSFVANALVKGNKIDKVPTFLIVRNGKPLKRLEGMQSQEALQQALLDAANPRPAPSAAPVAKPAAADNQQSPLKHTDTDRIVVAYDIPTDLRNDVLKYGRTANLRGLWDERDRFILQASPEQQEQFKSLLEATPEWRDSISKRSPSGRTPDFIVRKVDGQDVLEWPATGLSFANETRPEFSGVVVLEVAPGSPATWQDIRPGDVIDSLEQFSTRSLAELESIIKTLAGGFPNKDKQVSALFSRRSSNNRVQNFAKELPLRIHNADSEPSHKRTATEIEQRRAMVVAEAQAKQAAAVAAGQSSSGSQLPSTPKTSSSPTSTPIKRSALRYDGKSFDEWRDQWQNELSAAKRAEAVRALAAFGKAGYGQEATGVILDVAGNYDFFHDAYGTPQKAVLDELTPESHNQDLAKFWLPDLVERLNKEPEKWQYLTGNLLGRLRTNDPNVIAILQSLAKDGSPETRTTALSTLVRLAKSQDGVLTLDDKTRQLLADALKSKEPDIVSSALWMLLQYPDGGMGGGGYGGGKAAPPILMYQPELLPLLFHDNEPLRQQVRNVLQHINDKDSPQVVEQLVAVLKDDSRKKDHLHAIRALAAMGKESRSAAPAFAKLLEKNEDHKILVAILAALPRIASEDPLQSSPDGQSISYDVESLNKAFEKLFSKPELESMNTIKLEPFFLNQETMEPLIQEAQAVFPPADQQQLGGGGGFF